MVGTREPSAHANGAEQVYLARSCHLAKKKKTKPVDVNVAHTPRMRSESEAHARALVCVVCCTRVLLRILSNEWLPCAFCFTCGSRQRSVRVFAYKTSILLPIKFLLHIPGGSRRVINKSLVRGLSTAFAHSCLAACDGFSSVPALRGQRSTKFFVLYSHHVLWRVIWLVMCPNSTEKNTSSHPP